MRKILSVLMIFIISTFLIVPPKADANGLVSGSNALKNAVIYTLESAGVKFSNKEAKEKAYDAWNMKAYEMWQEDEKNGKNKELWDNFNAIKQDIKSQNILQDPAMPGYAKIALDWTFVGMAVSIGSAIGYGIQDAYANERHMKYLAENGLPVWEGLRLDSAFSLSTTLEPYELGGPNDKVLKWRIHEWTSSVFMWERMTFGSSALVGTKETSSGLELNFLVHYLEKGVEKVIDVTRSASWTTLGMTKEQYDSIKNMYESMPKIEEVPDINPVPSVQPLVVPNPKIEEIPNWEPIANPQPKPYEIIIPVEPFEVNPHIVPLEVPGKDTEPVEPVEPDEDTDKDKDTDNNKPVIPVPDIEIPPYEKPDIEPKPEETADYPEETQATETPSLFGKLFEWLKSILDVLFKILAAIIALPFTLLEMLWEFAFNLAKALFVPSDGFWDDNMNELKKVIWSDEIDNMIDGFESLGSGGGGMFKDVVVSLMGVDGLTVIDADSINSILDNIHSWVRGVFYPLLILFNVNSMYKLIRGTSLVEATRGLANRSKGAD